MAYVTDVFFAPPAPRWTSYIAIGDSFTEGLSDEQEPGDFRGWADRLAASLSRRRVEAGRSPLQYANLAVRGKLLQPILTEQLPQALAAEPDLISIVGGGNDLLRPGGDPDDLGARLNSAVRAVRARGIDVLLATGMDTRQAGALLGAMRPKVGVYNAHIWSIARAHGAYVVDVWGLQALQDRRMWAPDRVHMSTLGHQRTAQAALKALDLQPDDPDWTRPLQAAPRLPRGKKMREDVTWLRRDVYPWATRRLRRSSSGDARRPKRPTLSVLEGEVLDAEPPTTEPPDAEPPTPQPPHAESPAADRPHETAPGENAPDEKAPHEVPDSGGADDRH